MLSFLLFFADGDPSFFVSGTNMSDAEEKDRKKSVLEKFKDIPFLEREKLTKLRGQVCRAANDSRGQRQGSTPSNPVCVCVCVCTFIDRSAWMTLTGVGCRLQTCRGWKPQRFNSAFRAPFPTYRRLNSASVPPLYRLEKVEVGR